MQTPPTSPAAKVEWGDLRLAFIGGGNMCSAILGGLLRQGLQAAQVVVVDPSADAAQRLAALGPVQVLGLPGPALGLVDLCVWAVKPQQFEAAAAAARPHLGPSTLHLSVAAGIPLAAIGRWLGSERLIRCMPNTPALIGRGITGVYAPDVVDAAGRARAEAVLAGTGAVVWVDAEPLLDAVTALSGSGPAYVFYLLQAMVDAGIQMGLDAEQARRLATATFDGAAALAAQSPQSLDALREQVTSKGGTTHAAITHLQAVDVASQFRTALHAARDRAEEMGRLFGASLTV